MTSNSIKCTENVKHVFHVNMTKIDATFYFLFCPISFSIPSSTFMGNTPGRTFNSARTLSGHCRCLTQGGMGPETMNWFASRLQIGVLLKPVLMCTQFTVTNSSRKNSFYNQERVFCHSQTLWSRRDKGYLPFTWENQKFQLENQMVRVFPCD